MDYRERKYYLVSFCYWFNDAVTELQHKIPSIKIHRPYNHFRYGLYDGDIGEKTYIQAMISCKIQDSNLLEEIMKEINERYNILDRYGYGYIKEITKEDCKQ